MANTKQAHHAMALAKSGRNAEVIPPFGGFGNFYFSPRSMECESCNGNLKLTLRRLLYELRYDKKRARLFNVIDGNK
jgi:hypothetical protein